MSLKVKDLIEKLKTMDPERAVVIRQRDGASPCCDVQLGSYSADSTWHGELGIDPNDPEYKNEADEYYIGEELCVVLEPIN